MIQVRCGTTLDLDRQEFWPAFLPTIPSVGQEIESGHTHQPLGFKLRLQVVAVTWIHRGDGWIPEIELHMTNFQKRLPSKAPGAQVGSILAFYEWYAPLVGQSVSFFI